MNDEFEVAVEKLIDYANKNLYTIIKADIDLISLTFRATLATINGDTFVLLFDGRSWS